VLVFAIFYTLISMNGVVLGNDPAVHLEKAQIFLQTGKIPLVNLGWTPPLYEILLAMIISFSGATDTGQLIFLVKALAVIVDWLLFLSAYLISSKFFNKKIGAITAVLLLMCFPMYEANAFGGYTTVLGLAFLFLVLLYLPLAVEKFGYLLVTFFAGFALVLSHQLAVFVAVIALPPIMLFMLVKSRGTYLKVIIALLLGGGIAFFLYYFHAMIGYLGQIIEHVFFAQTTYAYQIPAASFSSFIVNFGFILFFGLGGILIAYFLLRAAKKPIFYFILLISFFVPLVLAESYVFGLFLPFGWFIYYLTVPMAIFAAVSIAFAEEKLAAYYAKNKKGLHNKWVKLVGISVVVLMCLMIVFRSNVVYGKIMEASIYYSTSDIKAYDAGVWLKQNYPNDATVVVTEVPGFWFSTFSGKNIIAQTDPIVQRNEIAESVLSLSYEIQHPQTLVKAYEAKGDITDENYVSIDQVWYRDAFSSAAGDFVSFTQNGSNFKFVLSDLNREIFFDDQNYPKKIAFTYYNDYLALTQSMLVENDSYPISVSWSLSPSGRDISNVTLYLSTFFDLQFNFSRAEIPQLMNWINPWDLSSKTTHGTDWAVASFSNSDLIDNYIGLYDDKRGVAFAFKFRDLPEWGNIGALASKQIDAVRFQYQLDHINANQAVTWQYQILTFAQNSFPTMQQPSQLRSLFNFQPGEFAVSCRDYKDYIAENNIGFIVYDKNQLDTKMVRCKFLEQIYSNDRYVIFKISSSNNLT
jgi:asparagine N-glycosylation enzyme membrane subunit Stt3